MEETKCLEILVEHNPEWPIHETFVPPDPVPTFKSLHLFKKFDVLSFLKLA